MRMFDFGTIGKFFLALGMIFIAIGGMFILFKHTGFLGKLPGDILIQRKNFTFYFPLTTSILLSVILSIILYFFSRR